MDTFYEMATFKSTIEEIKRHDARQILLQFGFTYEMLDTKGMPCPSPRCNGAGDDRFYARDASQGKFGCRHCCPKETGDVVGAVAWLNGISQGKAAEQIAEHLRLEKPKPKPSVEYRYVDEEGTHLYTFHKRPIDNPPWKKTFFRAANGDYSIKGLRRVLYNLPEVLEADFVFVVEGEACVEALRAVGLVATCNPCGAGSWKPEYAEVLKGKRVVVIPDNDEEGRKHADQVLATLPGATKLVLPGADKSDVEDWLKAGGTKDKLLQLVDAAKPKASLKRASAFVASYMDKLRSNSLPQLYPQKDALSGFEWGPGMVTLLAGKPGGGKTALATQAMLDAIELDPSLHVIVANAEMDFETIVRRQLSRKLSKLDSHLLRFGRYRDGQKISEFDLARVQTAADDLMLQFDNRVTVLEECNLTNLTLLKDEKPSALLVDYLQLFANGDKDARSGVNEVIKELLALKLRGWGILALSSIKRNSKGIYDDKDLSISSFKESGDCEFTADSAYVLGILDEKPIEEKPWIQDVILMHVKNRHGFAISHKLRFNKARQHFDEIPTEHVEQFADDFADNPFAATGGF